ncbi:peptidase M16 [Proteobacteria bacterium 005FR1]|nr:peptidase M16 [Proteobacteria bacterium 005FR1]
MMFRSSKATTRNKAVKEFPPVRVRHFVLLAFFLGFCLPALAVEVAKSPIDDRQYRYLQLPNELQVLLISDPGTDKSAAALDVFVGSAHDPLDRQGLAHFLEHMLFLGTEKYPQPDEYQDFINEHGGSHNAYTSFEHTNYFFDIDPEHLAAGLDRFAQFFTAPLFNNEYVERERHAVHSEYQARLKDEYRRTLDVYQQLMNPQHPLTKFSVGSLSTLSNEDGEDLRQDLLSFFRKHYNARAMSLVVLGNKTLDQLENMVRPRFAKIPDRESDEAVRPLANQKPAGQRQPEKAGEPLFLADDLPMRVHIKPEKQLRQLTLLFPIPPIDRLYRKKPTHYIGNLLGHEGKGSLLSVLKAQGWAEALSAGAFLSTETDALFQIDVALTEAGLEERDSVTGLVFAAIDRVARGGVEEWRYLELQRLGEIAFRFQEKAAPLATVRSLAPNLHYYEPAEAIAGDYLLQEYDPELIRHFAAFLNPDNAIVTVTAPSVETRQVTEFFSTPFSVETSPLKLAELSSSLTKQLELPGPNPFVPEDLSLKPRPVAPSESAQLIADEPSLIKDAARIEVWFKQDEKFDVPRASTFLRIKSPEAADSLQGFTLMQLYVAMMQDALNEFTYPASLAGLYYSLQANSRGFDVLVAGYNDGQDELFRRVVEQLNEPRFARERFANIKNELLRQWRNQALEPPYEQLMATMPTVLFSPWWSNEQQIETLSALEFSDLKRFSKRLFLDSRAELLVYGNATRPEAAKLAGLVEVELLSAMSDKTLPAAEVIKLEPKPLNDEAPAFFRKVQHNDKAAILYIQGNDDSLTENAYALLMQQVIRSPFFHQLRTEQQLGYVVFVSAMPLKDVPGTIMVVQSPSVSVEELMNAITAFANKARDLLPQDLAQHKSALVNQLMEAPKNLHEQASRYWESIVDDDDSFDRRERLAEAVMTIDTEELGDYFANSLIRKPRALWFLAGPEPDETVSRETSDKADEERGVMPIEQWPVFKAERESYVYP